VTVEGSNLDSVAEPHINLTVVVTRTDGNKISTKADSNTEVMMVHMLSNPSHILALKYFKNFARMGQRIGTVRPTTLRSSAIADGWIFDKATYVLEENNYFAKYLFQSPSDNCTSL